jgi:uncharacterized protein YaiI (UPF0178 family)
MLVNKVEVIMKIIIDADACPKHVLEICKLLGNKHKVEVYTVASFNHNIENKYHITVDNNSQEADLKVINMTKAHDVVITQDWGLAAMVLSKKADCLSPLGIQYDANKMDFLLEEREIKAKLRRSGGRTKGPQKRTANDDIRFQEVLEKILEAKDK